VARSFDTLPPFNGDAYSKTKRRSIYNICDLFLRQKGHCRKLVREYRFTLYRSAVYTGRR
jgi:hypothetical protein